MDPRVEALRALTISTPEQRDQFIAAVHDPATPDELRAVLNDRIEAYCHRVAGWAHTVINPKIVPDEFLLVDYDALKREAEKQLAADPTHAPVIAGVRFTKL